MQLDSPFQEVLGVEFLNAILNPVAEIEISHKVQVEYPEHFTSAGKSRQVRGSFSTLSSTTVSLSMLAS